MAYLLKEQESSVLHEEAQHLNFEVMWRPNELDPNESQANYTILCNILDAIMTKRFLHSISYMKGYIDFSLIIKTNIHHIRILSLIFLVSKAIAC